MFLYGSEGLTMLYGSGYDLKRPVFLDVCFCWVRLICCLGVCEYGPDAVLYTRVMSSLDGPNVFLVSTWMTMMRVSAHVLILSLCVLNDFPLSYVTPRAVAVLDGGNGVFLCIFVGFLLYSWSRYVITVSVYFNREIFIQSLRSHCSSMVKYSCKLTAAM